MRISPWLAAFLCALIAGLLWLALSTPSTTAPSSTNDFTAAEKTRAERDALWVDADRASTRADDIARVESAGSATDLEESSAAEAEAEGEATIATTHGVRVRVIDETGRPSIGWPVVLLREEPAWRALKQSTSICAPGLRVSNCGLCHTAEEMESFPQKQKQAGWNPSQSFDPDPVIARGVSAAPDGELFFPIAADRSGDYRVRIESVIDAARAIAFVPADPPPLVELAVSQLEYVRITAVDGDWKLRPTALRSWLDMEDVWFPVGTELLSVRAGTSFDYPVERSTPLRFEAWVEQPFASALALEPEISDTRRELVLDARQAYVRGAVQILDAEGLPLTSTPLQVRFFSGESTQKATLPSNRDGRLSFLLAGGTPTVKLRAATFTTASPPDAQIATSDLTSAPLLHPDLNEAHLDLSAAYTAGSEVDFGALRFGTGPILLAGRVIDEFGKPVPSAVVHLYSRNERIPCDANGHFVRRGFPSPAELSLNAVASGFANWDTQEIRLPADKLEIVLHHIGSLQFQALATEELLKMPVTVHLTQKGAAARPNTFGIDARAETFDLEGVVQFADVPITELHVELKSHGINLHAFDYSMQPGKNTIGPLDLMPLVRPLQFRFAKPKVEHHTVRLIGRSEAGEIFSDLVVVPPPDGILDLYVPAACTSWTLVDEGKQHSGTVDQAQPILIP